MSRKWMLRVIAVLVVALPVVLPVLAFAGTVDPLTTVSGPSPYASCVNPGEPGTVYVNAEVEPFVAVNPTEPRNIVGVWQQDRWNNGGSHGLVAGFSFDGGATW